MSPTSYQAAPPRTTTIAEQPTSVKFPAIRPAFLVFLFPNLHSPGRIRSPVTPVLFAPRMHVVHARAALIRAQHRIPDMHDPIFLPANRINRHLTQVVTIDQIVQRLRSLLLVQREIINRLPHRLQVLLQHRFPRVLDCLVVNDRRHADQNRDDHHHDHQFKQRKSMRAAADRLHPPLKSFRAEKSCHSIPFALQLTSPNTSFRPTPYPWISNTRRTRSSRPSSSNPDRPARSASPIPPAPSSGLSERAAGIAYFSPPRQNRQPTRPSPAYPDPADTLRSQAPRESSAGPPGPYTCQSPAAFPASPAAIPSPAHESQ